MSDIWHCGICDRDMPRDVDDCACTPARRDCPLRAQELPHAFDWPRMSEWPEAEDDY